ncbi:MAG: ATP-binding protein [Proteobacteria bacterium]|nr:ATP-binding protein [Pseudomonadota bacterium]
MKLVARYTFILAAALAIALSGLAVYRVDQDRAHFEADMRADHLVVGRILQAGVADLWVDVAGGKLDRAIAARQTIGLLHRANENAGMVHFEWAPDPAAREAQGIEGRDFVSRFPVRAGAAVVGTIIAREPLVAVDRMVHADIMVSVIGIGLIVVIGLVASGVLGRWLVGVPIRRLIEQARRIGRRDFSGAPPTPRADELGELAIEMHAMSEALSTALAVIAAETDARVRAVDQLRHADRLSTVGKLAAGIAHELGTPLSIVGGHAQMIAAREVTGDATLTSATAIDREVTRMGKIVRQLLDFARRKGPEGTTCDPADVTRRCLSLLAPMIDLARVRTALEVEATAPVMIDEDALQQVVTNLVVNAVQAMTTGGTLAVTISRSRSAPPDSTASPTPCVCIAIRDTGPGIPDEVRAHLFEPFFTTKAVGDGTGLGLAVVYGIVVDHRGWITVDTSAHGTTFSVYLQEAT